MKRMLINFSVVCTSFLIGLVFAETALRLINSSGTNYDIEMWRYSKELKIKSSNIKLGHEHSKSHSALLQNVNIRTNSFGMRGPEPKENYDRRILFLGSSITMGWGVKEEDVFTTIIEKKFKSDGFQVDILNSGVGNYNAERYVENFFSNLKVLKPNDIVIHYFINDAEILENSNGNFITRNFQLGVIGWRALNQIFGSIEKTSLEDYYKSLYSENSQTFIRMKASLEKILEYTQKQNINLYLSIVPDIHNLENYPFYDIHDKMELLANKNNIPFINFIDEFKKIPASKLWNLTNDPHPNMIGHQVMADQLYPILMHFNK